MKGNFWIKRGISLAACLVMISATTVAAAENTRLIHSQGQYTLNSTEGPIIIDTDDIEDNAEAIAALQGQLGGLSFRYGTEKDMGISDNEDKSYYWSKDTSGNWVKVGAVGTAVATDVLTGKKFSSEAGVDILGSMPNPTSANVTYYNGGNNDSSGATSTTPKVVTISNDTDTTASHTDNVSQINLGINEQITIPHGYYNKDIVIKNGVANRGSLNVNTFIDSDTVSFPDGFYTGSKVNEIYNEGVLHGDNGFKGATVTYHLVHQHIDGEGNIHGSDTAHVETAGGCFTKAGTYQNYEIVGYSTRKVHHPGTGKISYYDCSYLPGHDKCAMDDSWDETVYDPVYGYKTYPCFYPDCGHAFHESEGTTTDYGSITATQEIQSISIEMF